MARRGELGKVEGRCGRQSDRGASPIRAVRKRAEWRGVSDCFREHPQSLFHRRSAGRHASLRLVRRLDARTQRVCRESAKRCRRGGCCEIRARQQSAACRQRYGPFLPRDIERTRLAAGVDARYERRDAARCICRSRLRGQGRAGPGGDGGSGCRVDRSLRCRGWAWGTVKARSDQAFRKLVERFVSFYTEHLFNPTWGEQARFAPDNVFEISMSSHGLDGEAAQAVWKPFFEWISASPNDYAITDEFGANGHAARDRWNTEGNPSMTLDSRVGAPKHHGWWKGDQGQGGAFLNGYDSLWLPARLLREDDGKRLSEALFAASRYKKIELHINKGLAGATPDVIAATLDTATNPVVTEAFALAIIADGQKGAYPGEPHAAIALEAGAVEARG